MSVPPLWKRKEFVLPKATVLANALHAFKLLNPVKFRIGIWVCPCCNGRLHARLKDNELAVRCLHCGASPITQSIVAVLKDRELPQRDSHVVELSGRGALVSWLRGCPVNLLLTEYIPSRQRGAVIDGIRNEDVQALTLPSDAYDLCTSTEVFEHVADDLLGFREVYRILRPGGSLVFTVPLTGKGTTVERATVRHGEIVHFLPEEYHGDSYSGSDRILCFRNYGDDILQRIALAGFSEVFFAKPANSMFSFARRIVCAVK